MKKWILNIKLMNRPSSGNRKAENSVDNSQFDQMAECINLINAQVLMKPFGNQAGFVALNQTVKLAFNAMWKWPEKGSCIVSLKVH